MAKAKLPGLRKLDELKAALPPATARRGNSKGEGSGLMLMVPQETLKALRVRAAENGSTVRAVVLEALRKAGLPVPADELVDRRRKA
jgi:hypothetical protein